MGNVMNEYTAQGHLLKCRPQGTQLLTQKRRPGLRGVVQGFSRSAQRRLKYLLARLDRTNSLFITITQRDEICLDEYRRHWRALEVAMRRRHPAIGLLVWRVEEQQRGARHLHLIVRAQPGRRIYIPWRWLAKTWGRIVGQGYVREDGWLVDCPSVSVQFVRGGSPRLMAYVAKYVAKSSAPETCDRSEATEQGDGASLDNSNISAHGSTGRVWGVTGRRWLIYAPVRTVTPADLTERSLDYLRRLADWRRQEGYTVIAWSCILWDRLT